MKEREDLLKEIERLKKEKDAFAEALTNSNLAFMQKVTEFSIIKRISESISWTMDKRQICTAVVDLIIEETTAENCSLWLIDTDRKNLVLAAVRGQNDSGPRYFPVGSTDTRIMPLGNGAAGWVAVHGESLLIPDVTKSPHFVRKEGDRIFSIKSLLCLPIKGRDSVMGVLNMSHPDIGAFSQENERVLGLITDQAGIVLTNFSLFEQVQGLNRNLEQMVEERTLNLRRSEDRYTRAVSAGQVGIWDWQKETGELYVAPNLRAMFGIEEDLGPTGPRRWLKRFHPADRLRFLKDVTRPLVKKQKAVSEGEYRMLHEDGQVIWFFIRCASVWDEQGQIMGLAGSNTDITQRKKAEMELAKAQEEALVNAHAAGKAEFATTVLHNIGNVLNSVNVNAVEIRKIVDRCRIGNVIKALELLREHEDDLDTFLNDTDKGIQLKAYLWRMSHILERELTGLNGITMEINTKIDLMKDIIETQQSHARDRREIEMRDLVQLVDESLKIQMEAINRQCITIEKKYQPVKPIYVPSAKLIHVVINLIKNAIEAMEQTPIDARTLWIDIKDDAERNILLEIRDSGMGITADALPRMFTHGFTTKKTGHGFGLHYCARTIREMSGDISVASDGPGSGAVFTIIFPERLKNPPPESQDDEE